MKLFDVYPLFDVNIVKGKDCKVWDDKGQEYLDLYGGHAVISIGHCHPHYVEKLGEQMQKLGFYSNSVQNKLQVELAERLGKISGYEDYQLFLVNSGAEANENALKLASFKTGNIRVLSCEKAFHGRTSLAVEVTNNPKIVAPINDNHHVRFLPLNDIEPWVRELTRGGIAAVILECIQGVGGIQMATPEFAQKLAYACKRYGAVLICDEIQCGYGRSGKFFAHQWLGIKPDIITVAKGIGNGFPMSAVLISPEFEAVYGQLCCCVGRARRVREGEPRRERSRGRRLPDGQDSRPEERQDKRGTWSRIDDWHRAVHAPKACTSAFGLRAACLYRLFRRECAPSVAASDFHQGVGRRIH